MRIRTVVQTCALPISHLFRHVVEAHIKGDAILGGVADDQVAVHRGVDREQHTDHRQPGDQHQLRWLALHQQHRHRSRHQRQHARPAPCRPAITHLASSASGHVPRQRFPPSLALPPSRPPPPHLPPPPPHPTTPPSPP